MKLRVKIIGRLLALISAFIFTFAYSAFAGQNRITTCANCVEEQNRFLEEQNAFQQLKTIAHKTNWISDLKKSIGISGSASLCQLTQTASDSISQGVAEQKISSTGAVFTHESFGLTCKVMGESFRDPSGLIWGSIVTAESKAVEMTQDDAKEYCENGGARLPTIDELDDLAKYLGKGTEKGYTPYQADGKTDFFPGLAEHMQWSSSIRQFKNMSKLGYFLDKNGEIVKDFSDYVSEFRCVFGSSTNRILRPGPSCKSEFMLKSKIQL